MRGWWETLNRSKQRRVVAALVIAGCTPAAAPRSTPEPTSPPPSRDDIFFAPQSLSPAPAIVSQELPAEVAWNELQPLHAENGHYVLQTRNGMTMAVGDRITIVTQHGVAESMVESLSRRGGEQLIVLGEGPQDAVGLAVTVGGFHASARVLQGPVPTPQRDELVIDLQGTRQVIARVGSEFAAPVVVDLNGDGIYEVLYGERSAEGSTYYLLHAGKEKWWHMWLAGTRDSAD